MPNRNQTFDSNGPEGRVRGTAQQVYDKYLALARDAQVSGDRILAENFLQFAEHYFRVLNDSTDPDENRDRQRQNGDGRQARGYDEGDIGESEEEDEASYGDDQSAPANGGVRERPQRRDQQRRDDQQRPDEQRSREQRRDERPRAQDRRGARGDRSSEPAEAVETGDEGRDPQTELPEMSSGESAGKPFETAPPLSERRARRQSRETVSRSDEPANRLTTPRSDDTAGDETESQKKAEPAQSSSEEDADDGLRKILSDRPRRAPRRRRTTATGNGEAKASKAKGTGDAQQDEAAKDEAQDKGDTKVEEPGSAAT
uniref:DUF4167 domain-containing protein n=1 Tax=Algihabitans albus TaxID=2164067 RepID=UPI0038B363A9